MATVPAAVPSLEAGSTVAPIESTIITTEPVQEAAESVASSSSVHEEDLEKGENAKDSNENALTRTTSEPEYPGGKETAIVMTAIMLAMFLMALDRTIIATAIPQITNEFNSLDDVGWYGSSFMLTACAFQLPLGKIYTFYSPKWVFLTLIMLFEIGSAVCGAAPTSVALIVGRAIAGVGAAGIMSGAIILMVSILPLHKRPKYQGFFGAVFGVASVVGPLLGGAFTTNVSWRWCFYVNLPIGGVVMTVIFFILKPTEPAQPGLTTRQKLAQLDLLGELFLLPSIICLLLALQWGGATYAWSNGRIIALLVVFCVTLIAFILVQIFRPDTATIPPRIFKNRSVISAQWFVLCLASAMMMLVYYTPFWFQAIKGVSAVRSGIDSLPMVLALVVGAISGGQIVGRMGYYTPLAIASSCIMPIGAGLIYTFNLHTTTGQWIGYQIVFGFGIGIGMQQGAMAAQTVLNRRDVPTGVSLMFFWQQLGGAIFISVGQNVLNSHLIENLTSVVSDLNPLIIVNTGATEIRSIVPVQELPVVLVAYNKALQRVFMVSVIMACLSILGSSTLEWRSVKGKQGPTAGKKDGEEGEPKPAVKVNVVEEKV